jgi:hypothetical protein
MAFVTMACEPGVSELSPVPADPVVPPGSEPPFSPVPTGPGSAIAALKRLCVAPEPYEETGPVAGPIDPQITEVANEVEQVRDLEFLQPVQAEPISDAEIDRRLAAAFDAFYPKDFYSRRSRAWQAIGVLPADVGLREALNAYQQGGVVGFYNPPTGELVYLRSGQMDVVERLILAHELTHAIDDQHFDLTRLDDISATCRDEAFTAGLGAVEGSAQHFATKTLIEFPPTDVSLEDLAGLLGSLAEQPDVPPFVYALQTWPYTAGQEFIASIESRGGVELVDQALQDLPLSTEQVIHPERWPDDAPTSVDVPDLSEQLGPGWGDLDVMEVGEAWLREMLALRVGGALADEAAAGWDGGIYRAWTDGTDVAVVLRTVWDSAQDARTFADALEEWIGDDVLASVSKPEGNQVDAAFATNTEALSRVQI